jgi:hypothetical protein
VGAWLLEHARRVTAGGAPGNAASDDQPQWSRRRSR